MRERIKEIIEREGMSQGQFADYIGINRPTLSHVIAGRNNPSMDVVMKIHQHFPKINILWLLDGIGSYEGDAVADYPAGSLLEDRYADSPDSDSPIVPTHSSASSPATAPAYTERIASSLGTLPGEADYQPRARFYQGELFAENAVFQPESTGVSKNRKEMPLQTPQNIPHRTDIQQAMGQKSLQRKIVEIKIFYDDGTYETFRH